MPRGTRNKVVTLGFIGTGKVAEKNSSALLDDYIGAQDGEVKFVLPITKEHWTPSLQAIASYAIDNEIDYEVVIDDSTGSNKKHQEFLDVATSSHKVVRVPNKVVSLLDKAGEGRLIILWDDEDGDAMKALERASDAKIPCLDLTSALDLLEIDDGQEDLAEEDPFEEDEDDEEEVEEEAAEAADEPEEEEEEDSGRAAVLEDKPSPHKRAPRKGRAKKEEPEVKTEEEEPSSPETGSDLPQWGGVLGSAEVDQDAIVAFYMALGTGTDDETFAREATLLVISQGRL